MQYFWGIISMIWRSLTKNKTRLIPTGRIPKVDTAFLGFTFKDFYLKVSGQFSGVKGVITITKTPPTILSRESDLWIGCQLKGFLLSPNKFVATSLEECFSALKKQNGDSENMRDYISFLKEHTSSNETLLFERCFVFKKENFTVYQPFGSSLSGLIINLRH